MSMPARTRTVAVAALLGLTALSGCSLVGGDSSDADRADQVVLVTHESFTLPDELIASFEEESGQELVVRASNDAGALATKLALSADNPSGDVAFGIDNTFASRVVDAGVFAPYTAELPVSAERYALADGGDLLAPVDQSSVCLNVDTAWFAERELGAPATFEDLTKPAYKDLTAVSSASTSSPGMAFLLATRAAFGQRWDDYWTDLLDNGLKIVDGWTEAYYGEFTAGGEKGTRPVVLSYDSSPAFTVKDGKTTTAALLDTCFRQVEYAGVLKGAKNPEGAQELVEFLLSPLVQRELPDSMYVRPVSGEADLPDDWAAFAPEPQKVWEVEPAEIAAKREKWLEEWTDVVTR
ncbi:thiamine ABC transporter substrate-binding protein [Nocardioides daphniae]|uniref:Thiamine ABC transporter substrate-binding protein n=1 Tax=Nocardioides daphniae TaxID=402297 RepID=A0ABQ1Q4Y8_9ACTN|nr:thiamine ABC transporter substrate-binding protein [Nocardioides daphniae]GGD13711.1 thiamine ABC transporter substrate-binding protein [Nocardioides daphniae]